MRRILLYGGAFDPPHMGHEKLLRAAIEAIQPDVTLVIPTHISPHKRPALVPFADRAVMANVFKSVSDTVLISGIENKHRRRKSYTINTIQRLRKKYPDGVFYLLIGSDMLLSFDTWFLFRRLCTMVILISAIRNDADRSGMQNAKQAIERLHGRVIFVELEPIVISSTEIRERIAENMSLDGLVRDEVVQYARSRRLYDGSN